ncbi:MAG: hypothetical protein C0418_03965, partial [Coriobacteriaceae bacterium]|nr:hypothetical protein [Coriobacteriaceae bacterium]
AHGITTVVGLSPQLPIPAMGPSATSGDQGTLADRNSMVDFFCGDGISSLLGARLLVHPDPGDAARAILDVLDGKREALEWEMAGESAADALV